MSEAPVIIDRILIRRLRGELKLLLTEPLEIGDARPDDKNILIWYFVLRGMEGTAYQGGWYLGIIELDKEHPLKPPNFKILTPSGRFLVDNKICLSNSTYHSNEWTPEWNIKAMLVGMMSIWVDEKERGVGHICYDDSERRRYASESIEYNKKHHLNILKKFDRFFDENGDPKIKTEVVPEQEEKTPAVQKTKRAPRKKNNVN